MKRQDRQYFKLMHVFLILPFVRLDTGIKRFRYWSDLVSDFRIYVYVMQIVAIIIADNRPALD